MIMIKRLSHAWTLALGVLSLCALSSCDSAKKTNYLQDIEIAKAYGVKHDTGIVVQKGDKLRILVTSIRNPELTVPFNTRQVAQAVAPTTVVGGVSLNTANVAPADTSSSYLVDAQGNIQFPIIGDVPVLGLSLEQVSEVIRTKLTAGRYLTDAHVITKFANLRVYLLGAFEGLGQGGGGGAVSDRGSFHLDNAQTNILELIATVGGSPSRLTSVRSTSFAVWVMSMSTTAWTCSRRISLSRPLSTSSRMISSTLSTAIVSMTLSRRSSRPSGM